MYAGVKMSDTQLQELVRSAIDESTELVDYVKALYDNIEVEPVVRAIGARIGLYIPTDNQYLAYELFINRLIDYLELYPYHRGYIKVDDIINMSYNDFLEFIKAEPDLDYRIPYQDRLITIGEWYRNTV
jgi:hypothetical protein